MLALVKSFWQQEELSVRDPPLTSEDHECEAHFLRTHERGVDGRYIVRLPLISEMPNLAVTRRSAERVLFSVERKFTRDAQLQLLYVDFMETYENLGHMFPVERAHPTEQRINYLPRHEVWKEDNATTKLRVVFNESTKVPSGESLNGHFLVGPNLLPPLADVLLRWRRYPYVFSTDVEKMYRQILVHSEDRMQQILWRCKAQDNIQEYRLNTVTYGLVCAPFLAMRTLRQLAKDEGKRYPLGDLLR